MFELTTAADLTSSRRVLRRAAVEVHGGDDDAVDRLLLAYEELASNGFRHGRAPVHARVDLTPNGWLIVITDAATDASPAPAVGRDPAYGGLGLYLISALAALHGWVVADGRKHVWALVDHLSPTTATP